MKIIFIHGAKQQRFDASSLQDYWRNIFHAGLLRLETPIQIEQLDLNFPFYGDLIHQHSLADDLQQSASIFQDQNLDDEQNLKKLVNDDADSNQLEQIIVPLLQDHGIQTSFAERALWFSHLAKDRLLREFVMLLNRFPKLHETVLNHYIREVYLYLAHPEFMQEVHERVMQNFEPDEEYVIVAHSLGTVIAYNLLQSLSSKIKVIRFITLASPLAFQIVQSRLNNIEQKPPALSGDWFNFYSHEDYLTTFPLDAASFDCQYEIINEGISTFAHRPHEIVGYLQHPQVIQRIIEPLIELPTLETLYEKPNVA